MIRGMHPSTTQVPFTKLLVPTDWAHIIYTNQVRGFCSDKSHKNIHLSVSTSILLVVHAPIPIAGHSQYIG